MKRKKDTEEKLKRRQEQIIQLILRFRHLNRIQIQAILHQKHWQNVITWLNELTEEKYLFRIYEKEFAAKPSEYCLDKQCIPYLRKLHVDERILKRVYKEKTNSETFRRHCQLLATLYISLSNLLEKTHERLNFYAKEDLRDIKYLPVSCPDACFAITNAKGNVQWYFLDIFDSEKFIYRRIYQYAYYFEKRYWQDHTTKPFPAIILVCPYKNIEKRLHAFIQKKFDENNPSFYFSTWDAIKQNGLSKETLIKIS